MAPDGFKKKAKNIFWNLGETKINPDTGAEDTENGVVVSSMWGEYIEGDTVRFSGEPVGRYKFKVEGFKAGDDEVESDLGGAVVTVLGATLLDEYFESESDPIEVGSVVLIEHTGQTRTKSSNRPLKTFDVSVRE